MIKLIIGIIVLLVAGIAWLRVQWGRSRNKNTSKQIIEDLQSGKYVIESYAESLGIMICSRSVSQPMDATAIKQYLHSLKGKKLSDKFNIEYGDMNENSKGIVIGEAITKDFIQAPNGNKEIDIFYPCWLYIDVNENNKEVSFKSTYPENKDHHYLLEDLSQVIYDQCMKN
ncbi:MAG TPA: hypothetical protein VK483_13150 [Chitinophagaceae bacterium]|nr:hypothetical protein [Chitinophagaceae bacterium]